MAESFTNLIAPDEHDHENIKKVADNLVAITNEKKYFLVDEANHTKTELPHTLFRLLVDVANQLAKGNSVAIIHYEEELTTQQAADLLRVSRPYLIKLLENGQIRYHKVGSHRRIRMRDLMDYKNSRDSLRRANLNEMVRVSEALGLYESDEFIDKE
nr:helix-turn-helix domain-containing protein [Bacilli bacterium]